MQINQCGELLRIFQRDVSLRYCLHGDRQDLHAIVSGDQQSKVQSDPPLSIGWKKMLHVQGKCRYISGKGYIDQPVGKQRGAIFENRISQKGCLVSGFLGTAKRVS